jgi:putative PIG3 family NAD(P)H quinone oxidoreductase
MRYVHYAQPGGPEVLRVVEGPTPQPGEREVLIQVAAAGVNHADLLQREGNYPPPPGASSILGLEVAGTVAAAGAQSRWKIGDQVCALVAGGGYAEYCLAPDPQCLPIPRGLSMEESAGIPETFFTVWTNVFQTEQLKPGEKMLVHGGTSGVGSTAIQLAHTFGAVVFATAGSDEKCQACLELGARAAINYKEKDFVQEIKRLTGERGVDFVLDIVGAPYTARNIECLAPLGRLVQVSTQQGAEAVVNLGTVMRKRLTLTGSTLRPRSAQEKGEIARGLHEKVWPLLESGRVKVVVDRVFPLAEAADAHRRMASSQHIGKIILKVETH